jgi:hypothetical protein
MIKEKHEEALSDPGVLAFPDGKEARIEKLFARRRGGAEVRFSWWKHDSIMPRPLDLGEDDLILLFKDAIQKNVFTSAFKQALRSLL